MSNYSYVPIPKELEGFSGKLAIKYEFVNGTREVMILAGDSDDDTVYLTFTSDQARALTEAIWDAASAADFAAMTANRPDPPLPPPPYICHHCGHSQMDLKAMAKKGALDSSDPEPPIGSTVRDDLDRLWTRDEHSPACWTMDDYPDSDPESWTKVAGNYGPVSLVEEGQRDE